MIRPVSIALVYGGNQSHEYARIMAELIEQKSSQLPLIPLLVDGSSENGKIIEIIKERFAPSDHAFVFISAVYEGKESNEDRIMKMTVPNLMFEFGYLYNKLGEKKIKLILDFPFSEIKNNHFCFPSDVSGNMVCDKPELKSSTEMQITNILSRVLDDELKQIKSQNGLSDISDIRSLYIPRIESLFSREKSEGLNDYSLEKQLQVVYNNWTTELREFTHMNGVEARTKNEYLLMYLYERVLFFAAFHQVKVDGMDIGRLKLSRQLSESIFKNPEAKLFNNIVEYIMGNGKGVQAEFYNERLRIFNNYEKQSNTYSLPYIIIKNYKGLCYLNYYERALDNSSSPMKGFLENALRCFDEVLKLSQEKYDGTVIDTMLKAYAYYNRARVRFLLDNEKDLWLSDFDESIRAREYLSEEEAFPKFIRLYYKNEMYHSINSRTYTLTTYYKKKGVDMPDELKNKLCGVEANILEELKKFEETVIAGQSFFQVVKEKAKSNLSNLSK